MRMSHRDIQKRLCRIMKIVMSCYDVHKCLHPIVTFTYGYVASQHPLVVMSHSAKFSKDYVTLQA